MTKRLEKLMIIDGNAVIHRSFHALPPTLRTKSGELVNAVYGFTAFLLKAWKELKPEYIVLTLDKKGPTFRHEKYKEYKETKELIIDDSLEVMEFGIPDKNNIFKNNRVGCYPYEVVENNGNFYKSHFLADEYNCKNNLEILFELIDDDLLLEVGTTCRIVDVNSSS